MILEFEGDYATLFDLLGRVGPFGAGTTVPIPAGGRLEVVKVVERRGAGASLVAQVAVSLVAGVPSGLVANWLWRKLSKARRVTIDRKEVTHESEQSFTRVVEEHLEIHE